MADHGIIDLSSKKYSIDVYIYIYRKINSTVKTLVKENQNFEKVKKYSLRHK